MCAFAKSGDRLSEYTFLAKYLADSLTATMISGKPYGKSTALAELKSHDMPVKPTSCFTEVRNVIRNGDQVTAEITLHGLSGDNSGIIQSADRYIVVFVNSPPWQLLESRELEHWELDRNGKVIAHALTAPCSHEASGIILDDYPYQGPSKGAPPYFAVVEVRVSPNGSVKWTRIYKSSGTGDYDHESLDSARHMLVAPKVDTDCKPVEGSFFFVNAPRGYTTPQFTPHP
jgi:TonB family protein